MTRDEVIEVLKSIGLEYVSITRTYRTDLDETRALALSEAVRMLGRQRTIKTKFFQKWQVKRPLPRATFGYDKPWPDEDQG